jgi:hypothetical protein
MFGLLSNLSVKSDHPQAPAYEVKSSPERKSVRCLRVEWLIRVSFSSLLLFVLALQRKQALFFYLKRRGPSLARRLAKLCPQGLYGHPLGNGVILEFPVFLASRPYFGHGAVVSSPLLSTM